MSRRKGQTGHSECSGKWYVVRFWVDVAGQEERKLKREKVCPISGPGLLSASARERRAREIIAQRGADTEEHFNKVVKQEIGVTFCEQSRAWLESLKARRRKAVADGTIEWWEGCLRAWLIPHLGDLPLKEVNNAAAKSFVAAMVKAELSPKTINSYFGVVKAVVASAVDEQGEQIHPRKWNPDFIDLPVVEKSKQNTPCFTSPVMTVLAGWKHERERVLFILCGAIGLRIGEALGLEIDKHFSPDFSTISVQQKLRNCPVERRVKTASARREIDVHPAIAALLRTYAAARKAGFLFCSRNGKPIATSNILKRHLHPALMLAGFRNPSTEDHKAGNHAL